MYKGEETLRVVRVPSPTGWLVAQVVCRCPCVVQIHAETGKGGRPALQVCRQAAYIASRLEPVGRVLRRVVGWGVLETGLYEEVALARRGWAQKNRFDRYNFYLACDHVVVAPACLPPCQCLPAYIRLCIICTSSLSLFPFCSPFSLLLSIYLPFPSFHLSLSLSLSLPLSHNYIDRLRWNVVKWFTKLVGYSNYICVCVRYYLNAHIIHRKTFQLHINFNDNMLIVPLNLINKWQFNNFLNSRRTLRCDARNITSSANTHFEIN